jgi:hypothetical protein
MRNFDIYLAFAWPSPTLTYGIEIAELRIPLGMGSGAKKGFPASLLPGPLPGFDTQRSRLEGEVGQKALPSGVFPPT